MSHGNIILQIWINQKDYLGSPLKAVSSGWTKADNPKCGRDTAILNMDGMRKMWVPLNRKGVSGLQYQRGSTHHRPIYFGSDSSRYMPGSGMAQSHNSFSFTVHFGFGLLLFFETSSHVAQAGYVAKDDLERLSLYSKSWDYRCVPPHKAPLWLFKSSSTLTVILSVSPYTPAISTRGFLSLPSLPTQTKPIYQTSTVNIIIMGMWYTQGHNCTYTASLTKTLNPNLKQEWSAVRL